MEEEAGGEPGKAELLKVLPLEVTKEDILSNVLEVAIGKGRGEEKENKEEMRGKKLKDGEKGKQSKCKKFKEREQRDRSEE